MEGTTSDEVEATMAGLIVLALVFAFLDSSLASFPASLAGDQAPSYSRQGRLAALITGRFGSGHEPGAAPVPATADQAEATTSLNSMARTVTPGASAPSGGAVERASSSVSKTSIEIPRSRRPLRRGAEESGSRRNLGMTSSSPRSASPKSAMLAWITLARIAGLPGLVAEPSRYLRACEFPMRRLVAGLTRTPDGRGTGRGLPCRPWPLRHVLLDVGGSVGSSSLAPDLPICQTAWQG